MAADKNTLKAALIALYTQAEANEMSKSDFAQGIADAVDTYIKTFTVTGTASGVTSGGATAPVTGTLS